MAPSTLVFSVVLPLVLVGLIVTAGIALYRIRSLSLPISSVTSTATIILPILTAVVLRGAQSLSRRSYGRREHVKLEFSWSAMAVFMLLVIYETAISTLALTHMLPPGDLSCQLERRWAWLFSNKRADEIRRIQDRHQCCGLYSVQDRAWPFPDRSHTAAACHEAFGREQSCFGGWRQDEQTAAGLMLLVAVITFLIKLMMLVIYLNRNPFHAYNGSAFSSIAPDEEERVRNIRGRIGDAYHDDPLPETDARIDGSRSQEESIDQGAPLSPAMQPSRPQREGNAWGEV